MAETAREFKQSIGLPDATMIVDGSMIASRIFVACTGELSKHNVPASCLPMQCLCASLLCLTAKYNDLLALVIFGVLMFYVLTIPGIFILRNKRPDMPRHYKAFDHAVLPALYFILTTTLAGLLLIFETNFTLPGLGVILLGFQSIYILIRQKSGCSGRAGSMKFRYCIFNTL